MTDRHGGGLGRDADGRRRRRVADPAAARPRPKEGAVKDLDKLVANVAGWSEQAGSRSGEFTLVLANQVTRALFMSEDPKLAAVQHEAAMAALEEIGPRDPIEGMLGAQMIAAHDAAMFSLHLASRHGQSHELRDRTLNQANKLMRSCAALVEALARHRKPPEQVVRVERVTVEAGGQAIVGPVSHRGGGRGDAGRTDERSHAPDGGPAEPGAEVRGADASRAPVPVARGAGQGSLQDARGARRGAR